MKSPIIKNSTILVTCMNEGCDRTFRIPEYKFNSTIKNNPNKQECNICKNQKLLAQSTLYRKNKRTEYRTINNATLKKGAKKGPKKGQKRIKWHDRETSNMIQYVQFHIVNPYIRLRDKVCFHNKCISCNGKITQAGHRYSVGDYPGMRFLIHNIHGQEVSCNHHKSGNIDAYDRGLKNRHGENYLIRLKNDAERYLSSNTKNLERFDVIQIGITYKYLFDNKIWIFTPEEFNHYRDIIKGNI